MKMKYLLIAVIVLLTVNAYAEEFKLTCNLPTNKICSEDTYSSQSDFNKFADLCRTHGGQVLPGGCPPGASCLFVHSDHSTRRTYDYSMPANALKENCKLQGGKYIENKAGHEK